MCIFAYSIRYASYNFQTARKDIFTFDGLSYEQHYQIKFQSACLILSLDGWTDVRSLQPFDNIKKPSNKIFSKALFKLDRATLIKVATFVPRYFFIFSFSLSVSKCSDLGRMSESRETSFYQFERFISAQHNYAMAFVYEN